MSLDGPPDVHPPHDHKAKEHGLGRPPAWLEWFTSIAALIVSISSIVIALHHGETMDKLVKANSYPYLIGGPSDADLQGRPRLSIDLINNGVGPADERSLQIKIGDRYVTSVQDIIRVAVGPAEADKAIPLLKPYRNGAYTRFIAGRDRQFVFWIDKTAENARYWDTLAESMNSWRIDYCYCSVFDECWAVAGKRSERQPVKQCRRDEPHEFMP